MGQYAYSGAVQEDAITIPDGAADELFVVGVATLRDGKLKLEVTKKLEIVDGGSAKDPLVQTTSYTYHVWIVNRTNVFRYCSPHGDPADICEDAPMHHRFHHRHAYDPFGLTPDEYVATVVEDGDWPTLGQVIEEADAWYWDNLARL